MEPLFSWIKNIAFFLILITAVTGTLPDNHFKKYIKFFSGMLLIILLISPISQLLNVDSDLDLSFIEKAYEMELEEMQEEIGNLEYIQSDRLMSGYSDTILTQIDSIVGEEGLYLKKGQVKLVEDRNSENYGTIENISLVISNNKENPNSIKIEDIKISGKNKADSIEMVNIKNKIIDFYKIPEELITINFE